ncbi:MAG: hypothetical protein U0930_12715 [Pirellulales bacterium]
MGEKIILPFLLSQGWTGYWIDGSSSFVDTLNRREDLLNSITYKVAFVTRENVAQYFHELGVANEFELLSLDIDQDT